MNSNTFVIHETILILPENLTLVIWSQQWKSMGFRALELTLGYGPGQVFSLLEAQFAPLKNGDRNSNLWGLLWKMKEEGEYERPSSVPCAE